MCPPPRPPCRGSSTAWSKDDKQQLAGTGGRVNGHARNNENRHQQYRENRSAHVATIGALPKCGPPATNNVLSVTISYHAAIASTLQQVSHFLHTTISMTQRVSFLSRCHTNDKNGKIRVLSSNKLRRKVNHITMPIE